MKRRTDCAKNSKVFLDAALMAGKAILGNSVTETTMLGPNFVIIGRLAQYLVGNNEVLALVEKGSSTTIAELATTLHTPMWMLGNRLQGSVACFLGYRRHVFDSYYIRLAQLAAEMVSLLPTDFNKNFCEEAWGDMIDWLNHLFACGQMVYDYDSNDWQSWGWRDNKAVFKDFESLKSAWEGHLTTKITKRGDYATITFRILGHNRFNHSDESE